MGRNESEWDIRITAIALRRAFCPTFATRVKPMIKWAKLVAWMLFEFSSNRVAKSRLFSYFTLSN